MRKRPIADLASMGPVVLHGNGLDDSEAGVRNARL